MRRMTRIALIALVLFPLLAGTCKAGDEMTFETVKKSLYEGMSKCAVEKFFESHDIEYVFRTRQEDRFTVPKFPWKAKDAVGYYGAVIRDVRTVWWALASEHITIDVEINSEGKVSQVRVKRAYTGP